MRNAARDASFVQYPISPLPSGRRLRGSFTHWYFIKHFTSDTSSSSKNEHKNRATSFLLKKPPFKHLLLNSYCQTRKTISFYAYQIPIISHFNPCRNPFAIYIDIHGCPTVQSSVIIFQTETNIHSPAL